MNQNRYSFWAKHQYEGTRMKNLILESITEDFILPTWLQLYFNKLNQMMPTIIENKKQSGNDNMRFNIQLLDYRFLKYNNFKWQFLAHDNKMPKMPYKFQDKQQQIWYSCLDKLNHLSATVNQFRKLKRQTQVIKQVIIVAHSNEVSNNDIQDRFKDFNKQKMRKITFYLLLRNIQRSKMYSLYQETNLLAPIYQNGNIFYQFKVSLFHLNESYQKTFKMQQIKAAMNKKSDGSLTSEQILTKRFLEVQSFKNIRKFYSYFSIFDKNDFIRRVINIPNQLQVFMEKIGFLYLFQNNIQNKRQMNQFVYPYKDFLFRTNKIFEQQHYSLAFQGGGAKGVAYIGAYKAIKDNRIEGKQIPVKSIMGSSAGGIIALAVSTDIPYTQLQNICYIMKQIASNDRFVENEPEQFKPVDQYGNLITIQSIAANIKILLTQYGIISNSLLNYFRDLLKSQQFQNIQEKLIILLQASNLTLADIFRDKKQTIAKSKHFFGLFCGEEQQITKLKVNWSGLLLHGCLMKGKALHDIAAQCIYKYLLKQNLYNDNYGQILNDCFKYPKQNSKIRRFQALDGSKLKMNLDELDTNSLNLINIPIKQIKKLIRQSKNIQDSDQQQLCKFMIGIANKFILILNNFAQDHYQASINLKQVILEPNIFMEINYEKLEEINAIKFNQKFDYQSLQQNSSLKYMIGNDKIISLHQYFKVLILKLKSKIFKLQMKKSHLFQQISVQSFNNEQIKRIIDKNIVQFQSKFKTINQTLLRSNSYNQLSAVIKQNVFLDQQYFKINKKYNKSIEELTIADFLYQFFKNIKIETSKGPQYILKTQFNWQNIVQLFNKNNKNNKNVKVEMQINLCVYFFAIELAEQINNRLKKINNKCQLVMQRNDIKNKLLEQASKITLKQYYSLNKIQLTCTSVDLQDKILSLFNHKTSPNLPVCRLIQMTGSFPVAFKAQKWKKQWGFYYVHYQGKRKQIDIAGHEFTDGGLLANFPIKYLENQNINKKYFTHKKTKNVTIMLGFGLDYMEPSDYQPSYDDLKEQGKQNDLKSKALNDLVDSIDKIKIGFNIFIHSKWFDFGQQKIKWGSLYLNIVNQIPLFRFLNKLIHSYPNADRNFNLQAFEQRIFVKDMYDIATLPTNKIIIFKEQYLKYFSSIKNLIQTYDKKVEKQYEKNNTKKIKELCIQLQRQAYFQLNKQKRQKNRDGFKWDIINKYRQFALIDQKINLKISQDQLKLSSQNNHNFFLEQSLKKNMVLIKQNLEDFITGFQYFYFDPQKLTYQDHIFCQQQQKSFDQFIFQQKKTINKSNVSPLLNQQSNSLNLIQILFSALYAKENQQFRKIITYKYAFHKYIQSKYGFSPNSKEQWKKVNFYLNQLSFKKLYSQKQYKQITKHLNLYYFQSQFYENYLKFQTSYFKKKKMNKREIVESLRNGINKQDLKNYEKQYLKNSLMQLPKGEDVHFTDIFLFDVGYSIQRLVQYLYIQIKICSNLNQQQKLMLHKKIEYESFINLITPPNGASQMHSVHEKQSFWKKLPYLRYEQILSYIITIKQKGIENFKGEHLKVQFKTNFKQYLDFCYNGKQNSTRPKQIINNYKYFLKQLLQCNFHNPNTNILSYYRLMTKKINQRDPIYQVSIQLKDHILSKQNFNDQNKKYIQQLFRSKWLRQKILKQFNKYIQQIQPQQRQKFVNFVFSNLNLIDQYRLNFKKDYDSMSYQLETYLEHFKDVLKQDILSFLFGENTEYLTYPRIPSQADSKMQYRQFGQIQFQFLMKIKDLIQSTLNQQYISYQIIKKIQANSKRNPSNFSIIEKIILFRLNLRSKYYQIHDKLSQFFSQSQMNINRSLQEIKIYFNDYNYLQSTLRVMFLLLSSLASKYKKKPITDKKNNEKYLLYSKFVIYLVKVYFAIAMDLRTNLQKICNLPINRINKQNIDSAFMIKYQYIRKIAYLFYRLKKEQSNEYHHKFTLQFMTSLINQFHVYKFSLPLFQSDFIFQLNSHSQNKSINQRNIVLKGMKNKKHIHLVYEGIANSNEYFHLYVHHILTSYNNILPRQQQNSTQKSNISFFNNGRNVEVSKKIQDMNQYKQEILQKINKEKADNWNPIKYITSSNFHTVFGFLYALGIDLQKIRKKMYKVRFLSQTMIDNDKIIKYYDKGFNPNCPPNFYQDLLSYVDNQYSNSISQYTKQATQYSARSYDYSKDLAQIRQIYLSEKQSLYNHYSYILDKLGKEYNSIHSNNLPVNYARQIAKKYAIDYKCKFNEEHKYSEHSAQVKQTYLKMSQSIYSQFGQMIEATVGNYINGNSVLIVEPEKIQVYTKGLIAIRMMATYKIRNMIFRQLQKANLPANISLSSFYERSRKKVFLNFTVTNVSEQRLQFLNCNTMPNMPVWAAIIASSRLPFFNTWFWGERQWEQVSQKNYYNQKLQKYFKNLQIDNRPCTFYNTGNYISSLPIQLLTNSQIMKKIYKKQYQSNLKQANIKSKSLYSENTIFEPLKLKSQPILKQKSEWMDQIQYVAIAFNPKFSPSLQHLQVTKKYFKLSTGQLLSFIKQSLKNKISSAFKRLTNNWTEHNIHHNNALYQSDISSIDPFYIMMRDGPFTNVYTILAEANDNFIMKQYYSKLVKLPIKINTLNFKEISNDKILQKFKLLIPSKKAKETIRRSYEITRSFINSIGMRVRTEDRLNQYLDQVMKNNPKDRYTVSLRVQTMTIYSKETGIGSKNIKMLFLNNTKWNQNRYNNFIIKYFISKNDIVPNQTSFKRASNSEIVWEITKSTRAIVRFYYPHYGYKVNQQATLQNQQEKIVYYPKNNKVFYTEIVIDCKEIISRLPIHDSFDYKFIFAESSQFRFNFKGQNIEILRQMKLNPIGMNGFNFDSNNSKNKELSYYLPKLELKIKDYSSLNNIANIHDESEQFVIPSDFMNNKEKSL